MLEFAAERKMEGRRGVSVKATAIQISESVGETSLPSETLSRLRFGKEEIALGFLVFVGRPIRENLKASHTSHSL